MTEHVISRDDVKERRNFVCSCGFDTGTDNLYVGIDRLMAHAWRMGYAHKLDEC